MFIRYGVTLISFHCSKMCACFDRIDVIISKLVLRKSVNFKQTKFWIYTGVERFLLTKHIASYNNMFFPISLLRVQYDTLFKGVHFSNNT
jgi:hypothetical protein